MNLKDYKKKLDSKEIRFKLVSKLNEICNDLDEVYFINQGGCCYVAYCIAELLEQDNIDFNLMVFDQDDDLHKYENILDLTKATSHCAILLNTIADGDVINCEDFYFDYNYQTFKVSPEDILNYYNGAYNWNKRYNPSNNSLVKSIIEREYYEFKRSL